MLDQCLQEPPSYGERHRLCIKLANEDLERITLCTCETIDGLRRIGWRGSTELMPQENEGVLRSPFKSWVLPGSLEGVEDLDAPGK